MKKKYLRSVLPYFSLIIILFFDFISSLSNFKDNFFLKFSVFSLIYLTICFLPFSNFKSFLRGGSSLIRFLYISILIFGVLNILSDFLKSKELLSLFGNTYYGPSFLIPLFLLLSYSENILYWLNKICIISLGTGTILFVVSSLLGIKFHQTFLCYPSFFILQNFNYVTKTNKILIFLCIIISFYIFWVKGERTALIRLVLSILVFCVIKIESLALNKFSYFIILMILISSLCFSLLFGKSVFDPQNFSTNEKVNSNDFVTDTRTFLYTEVFEDLNKSNSWLLGKGPVGTYRSEYFYQLGSNEEGDFYIRHNVEVGVLHYLLKGGVIYLSLILSLVFFVSINTLNGSKNNYIKSLGLIIIGFLVISFIENIPEFSFFFSLIWILIGISSSIRFKKLGEREIKYLFQNQI